MKAFQELCSYLDENYESQYSLTELLNFMNERLDDYNSYTAKHLKAKLLEHYGDIIITIIKGKSNIVVSETLATKFYLRNGTWTKQ